MGMCDSLIKMDIARNCADPLAMGFEDQGILINRKDVDFGAITFNEDYTNVVKSFVLKKGAKGYLVQQNGSKPFNGTNKTVEVSEALGASVTSAVHFVLPDHSPALLDGVVDPILNGDFIFIAYNKHKGLKNAETPGGAAFEVYGFYQGLKISEGGLDRYSDETGGGWNVTLTETRAPKAGLFLWDTDYATTETMVNALLEQAV